MIGKYLYNILENNFLHNFSEEDKDEKRKS